jgi:hypothetical protein
MPQNKPNKRQTRVAKPLSLFGMSPEDALRKALTTPPVKSGKPVKLAKKARRAKKAN